MTNKEIALQITLKSLETGNLFLYKFDEIEKVSEEGRIGADKFNAEQIGTFFNAILKSIPQTD